MEALGSVRRAISVVKKRTGRHETAIRELTIGKAGLELGEPLQGFQGILQGVPTLVGNAGFVSGLATRNVNSR
jgi:circadian clock protein KaiC